jgi:hypothetical protein
LTVTDPSQPRAHRILKFSLGAILLALAVVAIWKRGFPSESIRYRLTLEAEVDGKLVTASSVVEVNYFDPWDPLPEDPRGPHAEIRVRGEAVALDLGTRGYLFATLAPVKRDSSDGAVSRPWDIFAQAIVPRAWGEPQIRTSADFRRLRELPRSVGLPFNKLPLLVRFGDLSRPETVERVDPEDLTASFGPSVKLVRANIELTDAPVTTGIEKVLPWLQGANLTRTLVPHYGQSIVTKTERVLFFAEFRSPRL